MIAVGQKGRKEETVTPERTAKAFLSGTLEVYATPAMITLMEATASESVAPFLEEGQSTVGTSINAQHIAATPVGMNVVCECELVEIYGRKLTFEITAKDAAGVIGTATHERFIVDNDKFLERTYGKLEQ